MVVEHVALLWHNACRFLSRPIDGPLVVASCVSSKLLHPAGADSGFKECSAGKCRVLLRLLFLCVVFFCELLGVVAFGFSNY